MKLIDGKAFENIYPAVPPAHPEKAGEGDLGALGLEYLFGADGPQKQKLLHD